MKNPVIELGEEDLTHSKTPQNGPSEVMRLNLKSYEVS
jgi:hypothetical protein